MFGDGTALSVLFPLRECINQSLSELLRRRPAQEPTGGIEAQILSIGRQCRRPGLPKGHFEELGAQARALQNTLSGTKQKNLARQELVLVDHFNRTLLFFNALLTSLDETVFRAP